MFGSGQTAARLLCQRCGPTRLPRGKLAPAKQRTSSDMNAAIAMVPPAIDLGMGLAAQFVLLFLPHVSKGMQLAAINKGYKNSNPRGFFEDTVARLKGEIAKAGDDKTKKHKVVAQLNGLQRAKAAHENGIEFFTFFAAAALAARVAGVDATFVASATTLAVAARAAFVGLYLTTSVESLSLLRTAAWGVGIASCFGLFWAASVADGGIAASFSS
ncbi:hypothetical protein FNF27_05872 [Cafeteria roenbergensis]|uniref:MAPEG family protein n=3 Tax=Cafeteria roenbergensis TaxID=33653 RepID=A0A5A8E5P8_CAFRO|nr:hypothetical protein FNF27_05872 [Cafeteria roenbergensis]